MNLSPQGAVPSQVTISGIARIDHNAFITALAVRALDSVPEFASIRTQALDYLESAEDPAQPNSFRFWPPGQEPAWGAGRPSDADDTAIIAVELFRAGRRNREWLREVALRVLHPHRVQPDPDIRPSWIHNGAFLTWLAHDHANVVDAVVNTNIAALFALAGLRHTAAYAAAVRLIAAAVEWTQGNPAHIPMAAPYYPHPAEFRHALIHAAECGAAELAPACAQLEAWFPPSEPSPHQPICSGGHGEAIWTSPALQHIRCIKQRAYKNRSRSAVQTP